MEPDRPEIKLVTSTLLNNMMEAIRNKDKEKGR